MRRRAMAHPVLGDGIRRVQLQGYEAVTRCSEAGAAARRQQQKRKDRVPRQGPDTGAAGAPAATSVVVQFHNLEQGSCWNATYTEARQNTDRRFKAVLK